MKAVALGDASILCLLALLHLFWAAGGRWGEQVVVPESAGKPLFRPGPAACVAVAVLLLGAAFLLSARAFAPRWWSTAGTLGVALVLVGRAVGDFRWVGFFKRERSTRFARRDTALYSPLCLLLGAGALLVALR